MIKVLNVSSLYSSLYQVVEYCRNSLNERVEIVVPDKLSLFMEKFLFEQLNISASFNIKVNTLNRFAKKNLEIDKSKQISNLGSILLINRILNENADKFLIFNSKAYSFSYAENIFRTIGQLKASKISVEEMFNFKSNDEQLNKKIADLAIVYEEYEKSKAGLLDASDVFLMSTFSVANGRVGNKILVVGFDDFTAIEYSILERLAVGCDLTVFNYYSKSNNKHIYNQEVYQQLKNIAYINEINFEVINATENKSDFKKFLTENLFSTTPNKFEMQDELVKIFSLKSIDDEIELVARQIRNKILKGDKFKNFGVAVFNLDSYINQVQEIFSKYEINYYIDSQISINKSIFYKFFNSILKYNLDSYNSAHLIDIINSPFFDAAIEKKQVLIEQIISVGFSGKVKADFGLMDEDLDFQDKFIEFMSLLDFDKDLTTKQIKEKFVFVCDVLKIDDKIADIVSNSNVAENKILLSKSKQIVLEFLVDLENFYSDADLEKFSEIYSHIPAVLKLNNLPLHLDCVKVVDANNNMEIFDNLFVVNCTQENAPNFKFDCGIILDNEIEKLSFVHKLSPTISHINKLSRFRLFNSMTMFENNLTITYSKNPSEIIKEFLSKILVKDEHICDNLQVLAFDDISQNKALSKWDYISKICKIDKNLLNFNENITKNKDFSQIDAKKLNIYKDFNSISASQLENYFKCPFYMFLFNVLKIKPRLDNDILSFDIGNVLHEIMFKYYKRNKQVGDVYEFCKREVFNFVDKDNRLKLNANSPILIGLIDEAVRVINGLNNLDNNSTFVPMNFEYEFKNEKALKLSNIDIIGKIDRVDKSGDMLRIVDYKSGKANANLKELYYGNKLQLFLYSCAVENILNKKVVGSFYLPLHNKYSREYKNNYSLNGYFVNEDFVIRAMDKNIQAGEKSEIADFSLTKDFKARNMPEIGQMEHLKNYSKIVSEKAVDEIRSGYIKPTPLDYANPCEYCPYSQTCLRNCKNLSARQSDSVNLDSFQEVDNA